MIKRIRLNKRPTKKNMARKLFAIVSHRDFKKLNKYNWHVMKGGRTFYAQRNYRLNNGKQVGISMHREILGLQKNDKKFCDHIDGNGLNNTRTNLRLVNRRQNGLNRQVKKTSRSQYKGLTLKPQQGGRYAYWTARIMVNGKMIELISTKDEKKAALYYNMAAKKYFGKYARLNKI